MHMPEDTFLRIVVVSGGYPFIQAIYNVFSVSSFACIIFPLPVGVKCSVF